MPMKANRLAELIEEMIDLKVRQTAQPSHQLSPDVARMLEQKRFADRQRLQQIRTELIRLLDEDALEGAAIHAVIGRR